MRGENRYQWIIAAFVVAICSAAFAVDCTAGDAELRLREAQKLCGHAGNCRCLSLALQPGRMYQEERRDVLEEIAVLREALHTATGMSSDRQARAVFSAGRFLLGALTR